MSEDEMMKNYINEIFLVSIIRFYSLKDYKTIDEEEINKKYRFLSI